MKLLPILALASSLCGGASLAQVGVSIDIRQPGVYGRIDIGNAPPPPVVYAKPIIYAPPPRVVVQQEPLYLYVPPGHQKNWGRHCRRYDACGRPVYFVRETWVRERWDHEHGHDHGKGPKGHGPKGKHHDHGHRDDHGPGRGRD
jgi:hypothetical protein